MSKNRIVNRISLLIVYAVLVHVFLIYFILNTYKSPRLADSTLIVIAKSEAIVGCVKQHVVEADCSSITYESMKKNDAASPMDFDYMIVVFSYYIGPEKTYVEIPIDLSGNILMLGKAGYELKN